MRFTIFAAMFAFLLWGTPAFAGTNPDFDGDGVGDVIDNCSTEPNATQDDTDLDECGNLCDADYDNDGTVGIVDFGQFGAV
ncbi:MAG: thrombospondin type 3 repeat-containing protein, partial [Myxococcota bacterium]